MRVQLAYPYEGHDPDDVIDVDVEVGKRLIYDGFARHPDGDTQTVAELRSYANTHGIDLGGATRKADIEAAIRAAETTRAASHTMPVTGNDTEGA